ncbi:MAG: DUF3060 domain-containing protein [Pyrinomonadaceae bacterium]
MISTIFKIFLVPAIAIFVSCDLRSETAKREMEKFTSSPTPPILPTPTTTPIAPEDFVEVDVSVEGDMISINGHEQKTTSNCPKYNRLFVNGDDNNVTIKGVCQQIMINGDKNQITVDASMAFVFNGSENIVRYSRFANGKQPSVIQNREGNIVEKIPADAKTSDPTQRKLTK